MANSDEPPYLTVGTEVSAKYRGAFCEATIKIAKKLVKCKVSYSKGQSAMVSDDCIKGTLKVGCQVDVKQPDGQVLTATITKLTDQSTYTVVFDDGDERTLKRSSLCLKGGRHFDKSESLDHQPLTDPETFGAPALLPKKNRRRGRPNYGPAVGEDGEEEEESHKKKYSYPPEFPVGKTVFLENDRRRASWLPAVIVPAHYVLEESDMKPDTICLRSFKDGRFFAATKNELHEFSPSKEPLLSMLEGEIQAMYMCKPAIERAMAYLDTGELPWGMDLFDDHQTEKQGERDGGSSANGATNSNSVKREDEDQQEMDRTAFMEKLKKYHESKGTPLTRTPILAQKDLDLFRLYQLVQENGGMERVTQEMKWRSLYLQLGMTLSTNASHALKQAYRRYLHGFEQYNKGKGKIKNVKDSPGRGRKRAALAAVPEGEETEGLAEKTPKIETPDKLPIKVDSADHTEPRTTRLSKQQTTPKELPDSCREPKLPREVPSSLSSPSKGLARELGRDTTCDTRSDVRSSPRSHTLRELRAELVEDGKRREKADSPASLLAECKLELSDHESSQGDTTSSAAGEDGEEGEGRGGDSWAKQDVEKYVENDRILVWYGRGKNLQTYEAKIIGIEENENRRDYLVHYSGWNNRYNEWIEEDRICRRVTNPTKHARPQYKKKKGKASAKSEDKAKRKTPKENKGGGGGGGLLSKMETEEQRVPHTSLEVKGESVISRTTPRTPLRPSRPASAKRRSPSSDQPTPQDPSRSPPHTSPHPPPSSPPNITVTEESTSHTPPHTSAVTSHTFTNVTQTLVPPQVENAAVNGTCKEDMEMNCAIEVKREVNTSWILSPTADHTSHSDSLLCAERFSGSSDVQLKSEAKSSAGESGLASTNSESTESSTDDEPAKSPLPRLLSPIHSPEEPTWSSSAVPTTPETLGLFEEEDKVEEDDEDDDEENGGEMEEGGGEEEEEEEEEDMDGEGRTETEKSGDEKSSLASSEKEPSPVCSSQSKQPSQQGLGRSPVSPVTVGEKRKRVKETEEEYESRRIARRESLNFVIDFSNQPEMKCGERVKLIEEHIRLIQQKWSDLKSEVAHLDRRRRRARRKEREAARILAQAHQYHQSTSTQTSTTVECH